MVKSPSPTSRPGVEAGISKYWSIPLKRSAEPTIPGTRWGRCAPGWRNRGSSKVNHAEMPGSAEAQPDWAGAGQGIATSAARQAHPPRISIAPILVDQRELDVVDGGIVADYEIEKSHFVGVLRPLHIQQKVPPDSPRKQIFVLVGPGGPNGPSRVGQGGRKGRDSVTQHIVLITGFSLADVDLDPALAECEPRKDQGGKQLPVVELLIKLLAMLLGGPWLIAGEIRTHIGDWIVGQREVVLLARDQGDGPLARSKADIWRTGLHAEDRWQVGAGPIEISAFEACEAAAGRDGAHHIGVAESIEVGLGENEFPLGLLPLALLGEPLGYRSE